MDTEQTRSVINAYYAALTAGDRAGVAALVADDCVWIPPATAPFDPVEGGDRVVAELTGDVLKRTFDLSKPFGLEVRSMIVDGDKAVVQQRLTATAKATGADYDNQYCWVYTCRDGKIVHMEEYADTLVASRAMGW
ncbi:MAG: nuclear transport factor 2 family protein [Acidimicrobiales bacterium]